MIMAIARRVWKAKGEPKTAYLADLNESIRINPSTGSIAFFERAGVREPTGGR